MGREKRRGEVWEEAREEQERAGRPAHLQRPVVGVEAVPCVVDGHVGQRGGLAGKEGGRAWAG